MRCTKWCALQQRAAFPRLILRFVSLQTSLVVYYRVFCPSVYGLRLLHVVQHFVHHFVDLCQHLILTFLDEGSHLLAIGNDERAAYRADQHSERKFLHKNQSPLEGCFPCKDSMGGKK